MSVIRKKVIIFSFFLITILKTVHLCAYEHNLAICAIFRNEARFMKEWIEYHKLIGVEHFYLYSNCSSDHYLEILQPYLETKEVDLIEWDYESTNIYDWNNIQCSSYQHAIDTLKDKVKWLALIDLDEYIVPMRSDNLVEFLANYESYSGLGINWQMFGTSFIKKIPENKLMIEMLRYKAPVFDKGNLMAKCIVRPEYASNCVNPHWVYYHTGYHVNADKIPYIDHATPYVSVDKICLYHYWSRDEEFLSTIKLSRYQKYDPNVTLESLKQFSDATYNQEYDPMMDKFIPALRQKMGFHNAY